MPKSALTSLANAIGAYPGFRKIQLAAAYGTREQELCQFRLSRYNHRGNYVAQYHLRNSAFIQLLIQQYRLTPVVMVRDLTDVVLSLRDHLQNESHESAMAHFTTEHLKQNSAELEQTIVRLAMPWYLSFYAGWRQDSQASFIDYSDLLVDPSKIISEVLERAGIKTDATAIQKASKAFWGPGNRINVGVEGRGRALAPAAAEALGSLLDEYPQFEGDPYFQRMRSSLQAAQART